MKAQTELTTGFSIVTILIAICLFEVTLRMDRMQEDINQQTRLIQELTNYLNQPRSSSPHCN